MACHVDMTIDVPFLSVVNLAHRAHICQPRNQTDYDTTAVQETSNANNNNSNQKK